MIGLASLLHPIACNLAKGTTNELPKPRNRYKLLKTLSNKRLKPEATQACLKTEGKENTQSSKS